MRSKKMKGPTSRRRTVGSARLTAKPPMSLERGMISCSIASLAKASPGRGSVPGKKDMGASVDVDMLRKVTAGPVLAIVAKEERCVSERAVGGLRDRPGLPDSGRGFD